MIMSDNDYKNDDLKTTVKDHEKFAEKKGSDQPIEEIMNGSMAPNMEELKQLGEDMKQMKTEEELNDEGLVSDPQQ
jgi:hypothetical protein